MPSRSVFTTRLATPDDHPAFARLFPELGVADPVPGRAEFEGRMLPRVLLACDGGEPIAYAHYQVYGRSAHVGQVVVDPRARGRGAGGALMDAVRANLIAEGCVAWDLNVKRENLHAVRLYEGHGLRPQFAAWAMRARWAEACIASARCNGITAFTPGPEDDAAIAKRFGIHEDRLGFVRSRPERVMVALREREALVGFAVMSPSVPRANPFHVARPELAAALFQALRARAPANGPEALELFVEADQALCDALRARGAEVLYELIRMAAPLENGTR